VPIHHNRLGAQPRTTERVFYPLADKSLGASSCSVHENVLIPGAIVPAHKHAVEEVLVCLSGSGECSFSGATAETYSEGSVVIIPAHTPHTIRNTGAGLLRQLSFFAGEPSKTEWLEDPGSVDRVAT
jgi:quercetin dioxygenase-like cupin family protein